MTQTRSADTSTPPRMLHPLARLLHFLHWLREQARGLGRGRRLRARLARRLEARGAVDMAEALWWRQDVLFFAATRAHAHGLSDATRRVLRRAGFTALVREDLSDQPLL